jgi:hypothetical protein
MARLLLDVPVLAQEKANCCWHTSANMIWLYWQGQTQRQGPMYTVPSKYDQADTVGLYPAEFITLAKNVGLKGLPVKNLHSETDLHGYLTRNGPLWCAGYWFGVGHIIVLTGVDGWKIYFNDPDGGKKKTGTVEWFNNKLASQLPGCLMSKDPTRY